MTSTVMRICSSALKPDCCTSLAGGFLTAANIERSFDMSDHIGPEIEGFELAAQKGECALYGRHHDELRAFMPALLCNTEPTWRLLSQRPNPAGLGTLTRCRRRWAI